MKEYEVYIPLHHNDGRVIGKRRITALKKRLIDEFGGLTLFPQKNEGVWKFGPYTFRDEIIIARVLSADHRRSSRFFNRLKKEMQADFEQGEILIVSRRVRTL